MACFFKLLLFLCSAALTNIQANAEGNGMNVLLIISDDLRPDMGGFYGPSECHTPNINRLMQNGVTFRKSYTQIPICSPSRTSFLSGLRPDTTRVWTIGPYFRTTMPDKTGNDVVTLPQYFKQFNYFTHGGGKVFHPGTSSGGPSSSEGGADEPHSWSGPYFYCDQFYNGTFQSTAMQTWANGTGCVQDMECIECLQQYHSWGNASFKPAFSASNCEAKCYPEGAVVNYIRNLFEERSKATDGNPFFIAAGLKRPHLGWFGPQSYFDMYDPSTVTIATNRQPPINMPPIGFAQNNSELTGMNNFHENTSLYYTDHVMNANVTNISDGYYKLIVEDYHSTLRGAYYSVVSWMDDQLGEILDALQDNGFWNNTVIVFLGDHGYHLGELGLWCKNTPYEYSARIPTIFRVPGQMKNGDNFGFAVDDIVEMLDVYPTLVEAAGLPANKNNEGVSLMPYIKGEMVNNDSNVAFTQTFNKYHSANGTLYTDIMAMSMRVDGWRYTEYVQYNFTIAQPMWESPIFGCELFKHDDSTENDYNFENENLAYYDEYSSNVQQFHEQLRSEWPYGPNTTSVYPTKMYISDEESLFA